MHKTVAKSLLEVKSISFGFDEEFVTYKGTRIPVYCDNRRILSSPRLRKAITKWLSTLIRKNYPDVQKIIGTAVAGISFAVLVSEYLGLPMSYVWDPLDNENIINNSVQIIEPGTKVVVVDDVINTGDTLINVVQQLRSHGCQVLGATAVFSYDFEETKDKLINENIKCLSLTNYDILTLISMQTGRINYTEYLQTLKFKDNPNSDSWYK